MGDSTMDALIPLRHSSFTIVILLVAYITVLVVGLVGNVLVIIVGAKIPKMKTATKYFILNLAIADLLVLLFCLLPNLISSIYVPWVMGSLMCKAVPYVQGVSVCASVYSLVAISADRLMAVRSALRRQVTKSVARRIIVLIWLWAAGLALPWLLYFELSNEDKEDPSLVFCVESWPTKFNGNTYFVLVNLGLCYLLPLSVISFCHLSIWLRVRGQQITTSASISHRELARQKAKASAQKMVIVVVVGFAACWLPLYVIFIRLKLVPVAVGPTEEKVLGYAMPIAQWFGAANSCVNPIFFAFFNRSFRFTLTRFLRGSYKTGKTSPSPHHRCHNYPNHGAGQRNSARRSTSLHGNDQKISQLKNSCLIAIDCAKSCGVKLHEEKGKCGAIKRSQTYQAAMANPV